MNDGKITVGRKDEKEREREELSSWVAAIAKKD